MTDTPLGLKLRERIRRDGPIAVDKYMRACLGDPEHGYYRRQPAIGAGGDFVTAPEISQVFGELIGLWYAVVWHQMGSPSRLNLVELGPGRGTLMRDLLRATRLVPGFREALAVHLVDSNETLRKLQHAALADAGVPIDFHSDAASISQIDEGPTIVIANEFLDALPVQQFVFANGRWRSRTVVLTESDDHLCFKPDMTNDIAPASVPKDIAPRDGDVLEVCAEYTPCVDILCARAHAPLAALFIDYGHAATGFGDTLQGVSGQSYVSPFHAPGETDLSTQVDFQHFGNACRDAGLAVDGPLPQAEFLGRLGVIERASRLMSANPARAAEIEAGVARLIAPAGMGSRFLAIGVRSKGVAPLPGFER